jgi:hypothetical protein
MRIIIITGKGGVGKTSIRLTKAHHRGAETQRKNNISAPLRKLPFESMQNNKSPFTGPSGLIFDASPSRPDGLTVAHT